MGSKQFKKLFELDLFYWLIILAIPAGILGMFLSNPAENDIQTTSDHEKPDLRTRSYDLQTESRIFCKQLEALIPRMTTYGQNWKLISSECNLKEDHFTLKAEVPVLFFTDDLEIDMQESADKKKIYVNVRSRSRVGKSDFGQNRRHINDFYDQLDVYLNPNN